jgi:hypothetical protein
MQKHAYIKYREEYQTFLRHEKFANILRASAIRLAIRPYEKRNIRICSGRAESSAAIRATSAMGIKQS